MWGDFLGDNREMWSQYLKEFNENSMFSNDLIHLGLGLHGIATSDIVKGAETVLDVGCGDGVNTAIFASDKNVKQVVGLDLSEKMILDNRMKYRKNSVLFEVGDFLHNNLNSCFELVVFIGSLDYIELSRAFFKKLNQLTKIGSRCYVAKFHVIPPISQEIHSSSGDRML